MKLNLLKTLRFFIPGILFVVFWWLLGRFTGDWSITLPKTWKEYQSLIAVLVPAGLYYMTPLRDISNRRYFSKVSENLRSQLVEIAGLDDDPNKYTWKVVRGIFFDLVDNDPALTKKASLAYFNGLIWTTLADIRIISVSFAVLGLVYYFLFSSEGALWAAAAFFALSLLTLAFSASVTDKHIKIGDQQIEIIKLKYSEDLNKKIRHVVGE